MLIIEIQITDPVGQITIKLLEKNRALC